MKIIFVFAVLSVIGISAKPARNQEIRHIEPVEERVPIVDEKYPEPVAKPKCGTRSPMPMEEQFEVLNVHENPKFQAERIDYELKPDEPQKNRRGLHNIVAGNVVLDKNVILTYNTINVIVQKPHE